MAKERLTIRIDADNRASRALRGLSGDLRQLGRRAAQVGAAFAGTMAAGAALSVREFIQFEDALTGVAKTVDAPEADLRALADDFRALSEEIPVSTNELLRIAQLGGQLGVATGSLQEFSETIAALDVATDLGAEEGALQLARFAEVMGTAQQDFDRIGSAVVDLGNNFAAMESEIVHTQQFFAGTARAAGFAEGEVLGLAAALNAAGVRAESGGSAMMVTIQEIQKAVEGTTDTLDTFAEVAGTSTEEFARTFERDAAMALTQFIEGMGRLLDSGEGVNAMLEELGLQDRRVTRGLVQLASAGDLTREAIDKGTTAFRENTALAQEASRFYDRLGADLKTLRNAFVNNFSEIAEQAAPQLRQAIDTLKGAIPDLARVFADTLAFMLDAAARLAEELSRVVRAVQTDVGQAFQNLGIILGARLGQGLFEGLETVLRESFVLAKIPGPVGGFFDKLNLAAAGAGEVADLAKQSAEDASAALDILAGETGPLTGLVEGLRQGAEGLRGAQLGFGGGGEGGGDEETAQRVATALGIPTPSQLGRILTERVREGMAQFQSVPALTGVGAEARGILSQQHRRGPLGDQGLLASPIMQSFNQQMDHARQFLAGAGGEAGQSFTDSMSDSLKQGARFAMQSLLQGLLKGRDNILDSLVNIGLSIASQLLTGGLFSGLGIASPSSEGEWAGRMVGEGLARGLESGVGRVQRAMGTLTAPITGATIGAPAVAGMGAMGGVSGPALIDPSTLGPMGQMGARMLLNDPDFQRMNDAFQGDARRRGS